MIPISDGEIRLNFVQRLFLGAETACVYVQGNKELAVRVGMAINSALDAQSTIQALKRDMSTKTENMIKGEAK